METVDDITRHHIKRGFRTVGYHYFIRRDGSVEKGRPDTVIGAHVKGHNNNNLGVCLSGGVDENNKPEKNYTDIQMHALYALIVDLCEQYDIPFNNIQGHRDWYGDKSKWLKECPCFDVKEWLLNEMFLNGVVT
jgi:N-acetyl-anhydromuramyl-L-alanine amidase AmpD